jgi:hypothetical protein
MRRRVVVAGVGACAVALSLSGATTLPAAATPAGKTAASVRARVWMTTVDRSQLLAEQPSVTFA